MNKEQKEVVLLKLFSGMLIMGEKPRDSIYANVDVVIENPRQIVISPTMSGSVRVICTSVAAPFEAPRLKKELTIPCTQILFELKESEIDSELLNGYKSDVSGIKMPSSAQTAAVSGKGELII